VRTAAALIVFTPNASGLPAEYRGLCSGRAGRVLSSPTYPGRFSPVCPPSSDLRKILWRATCWSTRLPFQRPPLSLLSRLRLRLPQPPWPLQDKLIDPSDVTHMYKITKVIGLCATGKGREL